jgi:hypothetical protein
MPIVIKYFNPIPHVVEVTLELEWSTLSLYSLLRIYVFRTHTKLIGPNFNRPLSNYIKTFWGLALFQYEFPQFK